MIKKQNLIKALPNFNREQCPSGVALFLDIDGTLLEISDKPGLVMVNDNLKEVKPTENQNEKDEINPQDNI